MLQEVLISTGVFVVVVTTLIFFHELGHYWTARRCGVRVETFSVGFGREIFGFSDSKKTRWKFCWIPLGGYVRMLGQEKDSQQPDSFSQKALAARAAIVFAGPFANFLLAALLLWGLYAFSGRPELEPSGPPVIAQVVPSSAAAQAGFLSGDVLLSLDGVRLTDFATLLQAVRVRPDQEVEIEFLRQQRVYVKTAHLRSVSEKGISVGRLGVVPKRRSPSTLRPIASLGYGIADTFRFSAMTLGAIVDILTGRKSHKELGGPLRIAQISGQMAAQGFADIVWFAAILSINLAIINLLPIPLLDGGHLMFCAIEAVRGRPISKRSRGYVQMIGVFLIFSLIVLAIVNDLFAIWNDLAEFFGFSR